MIRETVWRWELTPLEAFEGFTFEAARKKPSNPKPDIGAAFPVADSPLKGTSLTCRLAISDTADNYDIQSIRAGQPELPSSGDYRSGVQLLDSGEVIASLTIDGRRNLALQRLNVHPEFRGQRLGKRLILEWYTQTKRPVVLRARQDLNPGGARSFLAAQVDICRWAVEQGKEVPPAVLSELETGSQQTYMLDKLKEVERTGNPWTFQAVCS